MGEKIDVNVLAVKCIMDLMRLRDRDQDECMEKVQYLAGVVFREQAREVKRKRDGKKR